MKWTNEEIDLLYIWIDQEYTHKEIANELDRTYKSVERKLSNLHIKSKLNTLKTNKQYEKEIKQYNIKLIDKYVNSKTRIKHKCLIDGHEWYNTPNSILNGVGCRICANKRNLGGYGNLSESQAKELDFPIYLYNIKLQYKDEVFYKYGLTKNANKNRFTHFKPYNVIEELSFKLYDAWTAIRKEKELVSNYVPKYKFSGWTECYITQGEK